MEKLTKLKIEGFRSIESFDLELGDLTVFIGANGSGKSNLVSFVDMLSYMMQGTLQLYVARNGDASSILHYGPKQTPFLRAEVTFEDERATSVYAFTLAHAAPDRVVFTHEDVQFQKRGSAKPYSNTLNVGQLESDLLAIAGRASESTARKVARVFVNRLRGVRAYHFHDTSASAPIRLAQDLDRNGYLMDNGGNLAAFLYMLGQAYPEHYERIVATVRLAVPYFRDFLLSPDPLNPSRIKLRWRDRNPDYEFGPHQLSDGSLRATALITALLQPDELLPAVIVIDEPELGLHPSAVGLIGDLLNAVSETRQVVVATQSSRLLREFSPEHIVVVERWEDTGAHGSSYFKRLSSADLGSWRDDYDLGTLHEMNVTGGGPQ